MNFRTKQKLTSPPFSEVRFGQVLLLPLISFLFFLFSFCFFFFFTFLFVIILSNVSSLALLGIRGKDYVSEYEAIDILRVGPSDKQILLDIPRCHQYHPLLASPSGHQKFKRILKAWVAVCQRMARVWRRWEGGGESEEGGNKESTNSSLSFFFLKKFKSNKVLVYWQGLDSTLAPFLALHFTDEGLAFACLQNFMMKYLQNFYTKDNTLALQEYPFPPFYPTFPPPLSLFCSLFDLLLDICLALDRSWPITTHS